MRAEAGAIRLDARLDETAWRDAPSLLQLTQREPSEGAPATDGVDVRFLYDADALYVGARLLVSDPASLQAPLGRRDDFGQSEFFAVYLDTYLDRRTAAAFGVTAAGARLDFFFPTDSADIFDADFNPVWEARARTDAAGWTAELRIPFSQLRFNRADSLVFGLNVARSVPSRNEGDYWVMVPKEASGWASRFGDLVGIEGIAHSRRIELLPYASGGVALSSDPAAGDPFDDGSDWDGQAGLDAKIGIGGLNLDLSVNPDFRQVEADPAEVNLTAFETIFDEKRPFFLEGSSLLEGEWANYYYSRRIGAPPKADAEGEFVDYPRSATILGAAKLSGRLPGGWALGSLVAVTDRAHARVADADAPPRDVRVAPLAGYFVSRLQKDVGDAGSSIGVMLSGVARDLDALDPLAAVYARRAFTAGVDWRLRFKGGDYQVKGWAGLNLVDGEPSAIEALQRTSARYFQRPDADYVELDPTRRSLSGSGLGLSVEKRAGRHWLWLASYTDESPELELNDAGRIITADGRTTTGNVRYRESRPGRLFHAWQARLGWAAEWNYGTDRQAIELLPHLSLTWKNFWKTLVFTSLTLPSQDERLTRGGPSMGTPQAWSFSVNQSSNSALRTWWNVGAGLSRDRNGGRYAELGAGLALRPGPRFSFSIDPYWVRETQTRQYVDTIDGGGRPETYGNRYAFGVIERDTVVAQTRLSFAIKPDLTLDLYAEPFAASGFYRSFGELLKPRSRDLRVYGTDGTTIESLPDGTRVVTDGAATFKLDAPDFDVRSFRSTFVLRWEWRRGSTLYAIWQQDRYGEEALPRRVGPGALFDTLSAPGQNLILVKASFWLPVR